MVSGKIILCAILLAGIEPGITHAQLRNTIHFGCGPILLPDIPSYELGNSGFHVEVTSFLPVRTRLNTSRRQLGIDVKMGYTHFYKKHEPIELFTGIKYTNSSPAPVDVTLDLIRYGRSRGAHLLVGPSVVFSNRKFFFSPSLLAGLSSVSREGGEFIDTIRHGSDPSQDKVVSFQFLNGVREFGFTTNLSLKAGWWINSRIAVSLGGQYIGGPRFHNTVRTHSIAGEWYPPAVYTYDELVNGVAWVRNERPIWEAMVLQLHLSLKLPGN